MNQKGNFIPITIIGIIVILIIAVIVTAILVITKTTRPNSGMSETDPSSMNLFLGSENDEFEYVLFQNQSFIDKGETESGAFLPLAIPSQEIVDVFCWNNENYIQKTSKAFDKVEKEQNKSKIVCGAEKIGTLNIQVEKSDINIQEGNIFFNITAKDGSFNRLGICLAWSVGFIDVSVREKTLVCEEGLWKNYSSYNPDTKLIKPLPEGVFLCGQTGFEKCELAESDQCKLEEIEIPSRFRGKVDECFYLGKSLKQGESERIIVDFKSMEFKNQLDFIEVIFFDGDIRYNSAQDVWLPISEESGKDIASKDIKYRLKYMGEHGIVQ